jgi:RNA polymerase sigma-70 factor (ECF subfamily)
MNGHGEEHTEGLVRIAAGGDPEAYSRLFHRLRGRLEVWISIRMGKLLASRLTVDDVLQETFLEAFRSISRFRDQGPGSFQRWMFSVAENRLRDMHKFHTAGKRDVSREAKAPARKDEERDLLKQLEATGPSPSAGLHDEEARSRLAAAIGRLPESLREVLVFRALEERTYAEIAETLGKPQTTVRVMFCRALKVLKDELHPRTLIL